MIKKAVLLNGSPREGATTSGSLGDHLMSSLRSKGIETPSHVLSHSLSTKEMYEVMMKDVSSSDLIVLSYPSYADSPPSDVIRWMELVRDDDLTSLKGVSFLAIGNCEESDPKKLDVSMRILKNFSCGQGMRWAGALQMPMGPAIDGVPLIASGKMGRKAIEALDLTATAVMNGENVPERASVLMADRPIKELSYIMQTNRTWKKRAKQKRTRMNLLDKPLLK
jgi:hypothetical protein